MKKQNRWRRLLRQVANFMKTHEWCKGTPAKDKKGDCVPASSKDAHSFCFVGALARVTKHECNGQLGAAYKAMYTTPTAKKAVWEIKRFYKQEPYRLNDHSHSKEEMIKKILTVANKD